MKFEIEGSDFEKTKEYVEAFVNDYNSQVTRKAKGLKQMGIKTPFGECEYYVDGKKFILEVPLTFPKMMGFLMKSPSKKMTKALQKMFDDNKVKAKVKNIE